MHGVNLGERFQIGVDASAVDRPKVRVRVPTYAIVKYTAMVAIGSERSMSGCFSSHPRALRMLGFKIKQQDSNIKHQD